MKQFFITSAFVFISLFSFAQDQKWSVEANYPLNLTSGLGMGETNGVIDLGVKYRFLDIGPVQIGAGLNTSFLKNFDSFTYGSVSGDQEFIYKNKNFLLQPKMFGEITIPGMPNLKSQLAIGYTVLIDDIYYKDGNVINADTSQTDGGLNLNLGLSYDITRRFFVQIQYDYIRLNRKGTSIYNGQSYPYDFNENVSLLKAGVGFRF